MRASPKKWQGIGSIVCYLRSDTGQAVQMGGCFQILQELTLGLCKERELQLFSFFLFRIGKKWKKDEKTLVDSLLE